MFTMTLSEISDRYTELPQEYLVYAIYDSNGRCCYVGMTRVAKNRMRQHLAHLTNVQTVLRDDADLRVEFYTKQDIDAMYMAESPEHVLPEDTPNDRKWAESGEWYLCERLMPYLNVRKGWPGELVKARDLCRLHGLGDVISDLGWTTIKKWNPPFDHQAIINALIDGATTSEMAAVAGIDVYRL